MDVVAGRLFMPSAITVKFVYVRFESKHQNNLFGIKYPLQRVGSGQNFYVMRMRWIGLGQNFGGSSLERVTCYEPYLYIS